MSSENPSLSLPRIMQVSFLNQIEMLLLNFAPLTVLSRKAVILS